MTKIDLPSCWQAALDDVLNSETMANLRQFLKGELAKGKVVYPQDEDIFAAFNAAPLDQVRVVIIGQDPYHGEGQAHGLCFSVKPGIPIPPSLQNIYKELHSDLGMEIPKHGYLTGWAKQGVLLLNNVLTVEHGKAGSHHGQGWEVFTDAVIDVLAKKENLVFLLWGSPAQKKAKAVDPKRHLVLKSPHPSPLSAYRGFFGCKHFSQTNEYLISNGKVPIRWDELSTQ